MYRLIKNNYTSEVNGVTRLADGAAIPFDPGNTDYRQFKADLAAGASLNDANGNPMTAEQIAAFAATLP
jgi:hypothetical protein